MDHELRRENEVGDGYGVGYITRQGRRLGPIGLAAAVIALALLAWVLYSSHRAARELAAATEAQALISVATTKPQSEANLADLALPGQVQANFDAPIYARTSGYLKRWLVDIGTPVKAGQLLGEIETPEVDQQLRQAQADLAQAEANQKIASVTAERWRDLRKSDSVSKQEADEKISQSEAGDAQLQSARANLQRLRDLANFQRIVAPFDGVVTARNTDVGQLINAGSGTGPELFRVADTSRLRLYVRVPQTYAALMQPNLTADVEFPDRPGVKYTATLASTSGAIDTTSRTLLAQLLIDNAKHELLPGAYVEVHFALPPALRNSLKLPSNVLLFRGDGLHVATVDAQGLVSLKPVAVGRDFGSDIEIVSGVDAADDVILSPPDSLTAGTTVRVVKPAAAQPRAARS
jgi:RND family efflux transporter MFP subunit